MRALAGGILLCVSSLAAQAPTSAEILARGDVAWEAREHDAAFAAYDSVVRADSTFSTRALFRLGTLHAWANRLPEAIACHRLYVRLEPKDLEGNVALARTYAWASRFPAAIAAYDSVLAREADYRDAVIGRATALAWWGKLDPAIADLSRWQSTHPDDVEVALQRARFLSWAGKLDDAILLYDSLASGGGALEAEKGRARILAWRGDLGLAEARWRAITKENPTDVEAWVGLGQVLRWSGRPFAAEEALSQAVALDPAGEEAREQLRWVESETKPGATLQWTHATDSERNSLDLVEVGTSRAQPWNASLTASARIKRVGQPNAPVAARTIPAAQVGIIWQPIRLRLTVRAQVGVIDYSGVTAGGSELQGAVRLNLPLGTRFTVGAGAYREAFDDVVSIAERALTLTGREVDAALTLHPRVRLGAASGLSTVHGPDAPNDRRTVTGSLRVKPSRALTFVALHREARWDHAMPGIYFAPARFAITEGSAQWEWPRDLGLIASVEFGAGAQTVQFDGAEPVQRLAPRTAFRFGWRAAPGREVVASLMHANVAAAGTLSSSDYRYRSFSLAARWSF